MSKDKGSHEEQQGPPTTPLDPEESKGEESGQTKAAGDDDHVETNAGENAKDGGIAEASDQPSKAGE